MTVQSFDADALRHLKRARLGHILRAPLRTRAGLPRSAREGLQLSALVERRAEYEPMLRSTSPQILSPLHARGLRVIPWTVNDPQRMRELIRPDRPDLLLRLLRR